MTVSIISHQLFPHKIHPVSSHVSGLRLACLVVLYGNLTKPVGNDEAATRLDLDSWNVKIPATTAERLREEGEERILTVLLTP